MKIEINTVAEIIKSEHVAPEIVRRIVEQMNLAVQPDDAEESAPAVKKQFVILLSDPTGRLSPEFFQAAGFSDFAGWVLQIPESESVATTQDRIFRAAYDYNTTKKGRLYPAKTVGEAIENVPAKFFKETEVWVKSKTPVQILTTNNLIPRE